MKLFFFIGVIALIGAEAHVSVKVKSDNSITKALKKSELIPDILSEGPSFTLKVCYSSGVCANKGKELTPTQVKNQPFVDWRAKENKYYTLMLCGADALSRDDHKLRELSHWLVGNIPGKNIDAGDVINEYIGSGSPENTGFHRYLLALYEQPGKLNFTEPHVTRNAIEGRFYFNSRNFSKKYNLGKPLAANFYQAKYDDYVPTLHKQIGLDVSKL